MAPRAPLFGATGLACPSVRLCVAVGSSGIVTSTLPTGGPAAWKRANVKTPGTPEQISCASASLCVVTDDNGNILTSTDQAVGQLGTRLNLILVIG
jgi:hypothetical protein